MANERWMIDANVLNRALTEEYHGMLSDETLKIYQVIRILDECPTLDAVEVVRCKDCIHRVYVDMGDDIGEIGGCELFGCAMHYDAFCSYGERKDNG